MKQGQVEYGIRVRVGETRGRREVKLNGIIYNTTFVCTYCL